MRSAPLFIAAASVTLIAGSAFSAPSSGGSVPPYGNAPPASSSSSGTAPSASTGTSANTSATTGAFTVGMPVKDNTGATIGTITNLTTDPTGKQAAVIKMGSDQFQVATSNLSAANGAATINLTQAQITSMLHKNGAAPPSSGATPPSGGATPGGSEMPSGGSTGPK